MNKFWIFACLLIILGLSHIPASLSSPTGSEGDSFDDYHDDANDGEDESDSNEEQEQEFGEQGEAKMFTNPMTIEADVGGEFQLSCHGDPKGSAALWSKESTGATLFVDEHSSTGDSRFTVDFKPGQSSLILKNVTASDTGRYKCQYSTGSGVQVVHTVNVRVAPHVHVSPAFRVLKHGEPATLSCNVTGYPKPRVFWERKGKRMPTGEPKIEGTEIMFDSVTRHHAGVYECFAENSVGSARTAFKLDIMFPPEIEIQKESVHTGEGLAADLECFVHAEPKATVIWYKDGQEVVQNRHEAVVKMNHHYILHLKDVTTEDFGNYNCLATNPMGRSNKSINLSGAPSQPVISTEETGVAKNDPLSYNLVWKLESTIKVENFKLKYRKVDEDWTVEDAMGSLIQPHVYTVTHTLNNLSPHAEYETTLTAANEYGSSRESRPYTFHVTGKDYQSQEADKDVDNVTADESKGSAGSAGRYSMNAFIALFLTILSTHLLRC